MAKCKAEGCHATFDRAKGDMRTVWCSTDCAIVIARAIQDKNRQKAQAREKSQKKKQTTANRVALREYNKRDVPWQKKTTQPRFNRLRVLQELKWFQDRGIAPYCISCRKTNMDWCCGHFISVGAAGSLRFEPRNTYLQCNRDCNCGQSSNRSGYEEGLIFRFGELQGEAIIEWCKMNKGKRKWQWEELEAIRKEANAGIRELERNLT